MELVNPYVESGERNYDDNMKSQRNYQSLLGNVQSSGSSSGFGTGSTVGLMRSQSDDEMLDITTGTTDDLRRVPNRSHGNSNLLRSGGGANLLDPERIESTEDEFGLLRPNFDSLFQ